MWLFDKLAGRISGVSAGTLFDEVRISPAMANHITESLRAFYQTASWAKKGIRQSALPVSLYANAMESMEEFDRTLTEFWYEIHSGKRKRIVERSAIRPRGKQPKPGELPWAGWRGIEGCEVSSDD